MQRRGVPVWRSAVSGGRWSTPLAAIASTVERFLRLLPSLLGWRPASSASLPAELTAGGREAAGSAAGRGVPYR